MPAFPCPSCGQRLKVKETLAGRKIRCPGCQEVATVPVADEPAPADLPVSRSQEETRALRPNAARDDSVTPGGATRGSALAEEKLLAMLAPAQQHDEIGRLGGYRILRLLGKGGMGVVFHGEDEVLRRPVALKVIRPECLHEEARRRFLREARALAAVMHDNVVTIFQVGQEGPILYLAMPLLEGGTLTDHLEAGGLPVAEAVRIAQEMALGLQAAHARGLIHRDIKPSNVWLEGESRRVKLLDFGLAHEIGSNDGLTHSGVIMGTPAYMSPEQARGQRLDHRADLYSLGCVLYEMCTSIPPFYRPDTAGLLASILTEEPRPVRKLAPQVPPRLAELIHQLMAKDPDERPESAEEVVTRLRKWEAGATADTSIQPRSKGPGQTRRSPRKTPRRQGRGLLVGLVVGGALVLCGVLLAGAYFLGRGSTSAEPSSVPEQSPWKHPEGPLGHSPRDFPGPWQDHQGRKGLPHPGMGKKGPLPGRDSGKGPPGPFSP